jgi:hypothetical protein
VRCQVGDEGVDVVNYFMDAELDAKYYRPSLPEEVNVASWMLDVIGAGTSAKGLIAPYDTVYEASELCAQNTATIKRLSTPSFASPPARFDSVYACSYARQLFHVLRRFLTIYWRDTSYNNTKFRILLVLGTLTGLLYLRIDDTDEAGLISKLAIMALAGGLFGVVQSTSVLPLVVKLRESFYRERASHTYAPWVYSMAQGLVELPFLLISTLLFTTPYYFMLLLSDSADKFFQYILAMYLLSIVFTYSGHMFGALCPDIQVASIAQGGWFLICFLFSGIFIPLNSMPAGWRFMYYIVPLPKLQNAICIQQFECDPATAVCPLMLSFELQGIVTKWEFVQRKIGPTVGGWEAQIAYQIITIIVFRALVTLIVHKISHVRR